MKLFVVTTLTAACLMFGAEAPAQPSPPNGAQAPAMRPGPMHGPRGPGMGRFGAEATPGWSMMTPQERDEHRQRMLSATTREECRKAMDEHRKIMEDRAKERGIPMRQPRRDACARFPA